MTAVSTHIFSTMGTVASVRVGPDADVADVIAELKDSFDTIEDTFSLYLDGSELSRMARGEIALWQAGPRVLDAYAQALDWRTATNGTFSPHRPDEVIDLSGIVKAIAIENAGRILDGSQPNWLVTVGGDVLSRGTNVGLPWRCAIVDPADRAALLSVAELQPDRRAVATSGTSERGEHVWRSTPDSSFCQVTVTASDIVTADVLATALLSGGRSDLDGMVARFDVGVLAVTRDGRLYGTPSGL